jgi:hypothetical protein
VSTTAIHSQPQLMPTASVKEIKQALEQRPTADLVGLCLRLAKFKKENKELLSYLLFEAADEAAFVRRVQEELTEQFSAINTKSFFYIKAGVRKILRSVKTTIRYSSKQETEVALLLHFCTELQALRPSIKKNTVLTNLYLRQLERIRKVIPSLHEDLQHDYGLELERL